MIFLKDAQEKKKIQTFKILIYGDNFITTHLTMQIYKDLGSKNLFYDTVTLRLWSKSHKAQDKTLTIIMQFCRLFMGMLSGFKCW